MKPWTDVTHRRKPARLKSWSVGFLVAALLGSAGTLYAKFEQEQLALESQIQNRIESILAKTLRPNSYLITVKVEMDQKAASRTIRSTGGGAAPSPFVAENRFVLPGVPVKKEFVGAQAPSETIINSYADEALIKRISISILVAPDVTPEQIQGMRDVLSASLPFNPLRGDEMDIQPSNLLKSATPESTVGNTGSAGATPTGSAASRFKTSVLSDRGTLTLVVLLGAVTLILSVLLIFLFGPVRAFLNRLLTVLPRVGEQAAYAVNSAPKTAATGPTNGTVTANGLAVNGHGTHNENGDQLFGFIREDQLNKLPILFRQMSPTQAALVLAYLPPDWASRVIGAMDTTSQSAIMRELAQPREVPPEVVKEVESQVKNKLPYLVGGVDWIQSVYQFTQPQAQKALLGSLNQQSPELADALRKKSFFFEDLVLLNSGALRLVVQEAGYPAIAAALRDETADTMENILRKLPAATREIVQQEMEMSIEDKAAIADAKARVTALARRMVVEGRIAVPEKK